MGLVLAALLVAAYGFADRFGGGGWPALDAKLPGRGVFWGAVLAGVVGWFALGGAGIVAAIAWLAYRTPAWKQVRLPSGKRWAWLGSLQGGQSSTTPRTKPETAATLIRHLIPAPLVAIDAAMFDRDWTVTLLPMLAFALVATGLGRAYAESVDDGHDINAWVETVRGLVYGASIFTALGAL